MEINQQDAPIGIENPHHFGDHRHSHPLVHLMQNEHTEDQVKGVAFIGHVRRITKAECCVFTQSVSGNIQHGRRGINTIQLTAESTV